MSMTIKAYTCELLCEVDFFEDRDKEPSDSNRVGASHPRRRSVGHPYSKIAELVKEKFPEARVSTTSVRRVSGRISAEEHGYETYLLPGRRPRSQVKR